MGGSGSALGAAYIGVLEVLERECIQVNCVVGASMSGLFAGSCAVGPSLQSIRDKLAKADWIDLCMDV